MRVRSPARRDPAGGIPIHLRDDQPAFDQSVEHGGDRIGAGRNRQQPEPNGGVDVGLRDRCAVDTARMRSMTSGAAPAGVAASATANRTSAMNRGIERGRTPRVTAPTQKAWPTLKWNACPGSRRPATT